MNNTIPVSYHSSIAEYMASRPRVVKHLTLCSPYLGGTKPSAPADDDDEQTEDTPYVPVQWPIPEEWARNPDRPRPAGGERTYDYDDDDDD